MPVTTEQENIIREAYERLGSIRAAARETGRNPRTVARVVALGGKDTSGPAIDYDVLAAKVAARLSQSGPVNEGPPQAALAPSCPAVVFAPQIYARTVVISDLHYPYQDQSAIAAMFDFCRAWKPQLIIINGDLFDAYMISCYTKSPEQLNHHLQREFDLAKPFVKILDSIGSDIVYILGNHEARIDSLKSEMPGLAKLRALEWHNMAELPERWQILPQFTRYRLGSLDIHHGDLMQGPGGRYVAARMLERLKRSSLFGHFHRDQFYCEPDGDGVVRGAFASGHLCDAAEAAKYCRLNNWATGFRSIDADPDTELFEVRSHLIHGGKCRANGVTYGA